MSITFAELKAQAHQGVGKRIFTTKDGVDITDATILRAINNAQTQLARFKGFGELYARENIFLPIGNSSIPVSNSYRSISMAIIHYLTSTTLSSEITDLPNGIYVDAAASLVYTLDETQANIPLRGVTPDTYHSAGSQVYQMNAKPTIYSMYNSKNIILSPKADTNYFLTLHGKIWPRPFLAIDSDSIQTMFVEKDDILVSLAMVELFKGLNDMNSANQHYAVVKNAVAEATTTDNESTKLENDPVSSYRNRHGSRSGNVLRLDPNASKADLGIV